MDSVLDYQNYEVLRNVFCDQSLRQSVRLLSVFGCGAGEAIYVTNKDEVYGFGRNRYGGLGLGFDTEQVPVPQLNVTLTGKQLSDFICGFEHWIALTSSGQLYSWGHNSFGQLGIGTEEPTATPQLIRQLEDKTVTQVCCGGFNTMVLTDDGQVYGWGENDCGQLGDTTYLNRWTPVHIPFDCTIKSISCGIKYSLALNEIGTVYIWGLNSFGQLGLKINEDCLAQPMAINHQQEIKFEKAVCGPLHTLLLSTDGYVYAFGDNRCGQIGNGKLKPQKRPHLVCKDVKFKDVITNKENEISIAVSTDDRYYVWGLAFNRRYSTPKVITTGDSVFDVYAKAVRKAVTHKTVVISDDLMSWERISTNFEFKSSNPMTNNLKPVQNIKPILKTVSKVNNRCDSYSKTVKNFVDFENFTRYDLLALDSKVVDSIRLFHVFQRGQSVIFVTNDDKVYALGFNRKGTLGLGHKRENLRKPELNLILSGKQVFDFVSGFEHTIALTEYGECYSWGDNKYGQLGIGSNDDATSPQLIQEFTDKTVIMISSGSYHSMAMTSDGDLFTWGHNTFAQLGDGTYNSRTAPVQVLIKDRVISASCGGNHSIAVTVHGIAYVWGSNEFGELGRPKESDIRKNRLSAMCKNPSKVNGIADSLILRAYGGDRFTLLLTTTGNVYSFGCNSFGQIGNGSTDTQFEPYLLNSKNRIKDIVCDWRNDMSIAVTENNEVFVWGLVKDEPILRPKLIQNYGKSLFDIYLKLAKHKVIQKTLNTNEDITDLNQINPISIQSTVILDFYVPTESSNQSNYSDYYNSSENLNQLEDNYQVNRGHNYGHYSEDYSEDYCGHNCEDNYPNNEFKYENKNILLSTEDQTKQSSVQSSDLDEYQTICGLEFLKHLSYSFNNPNKYDLKFVSENKVIYCHKTVLQIRNEKFWQILCKNITEDKNQIIINPKTFDSFYAFIQYMYGIEPEIEAQFINDLKEMAKHFNEPGIEKLCADYVQQLIVCVDPSNVCAFYERAVYFNLNDLEKYCVELIAKNKCVLKTEAFQQLDDSLSKQLLSAVLLNLCD